MPAGARQGLAFLAGLAFVLFGESARAELKMRWDCYLPGAAVDCGVLEGSLTSKIPFLTVVGEGAHPDVVVTLSSVPAENATRYELHLVGRQRGGEMTDIRTNDKIPSSIDSATATVRILTKLQRGLANFMDQKVAGEMKDGHLDIQVIDPVQMPFTGRPEQSGIRWYVTPSIGTYFSDVQGVGINASGNATLSFNLSEPTFRLQQALGASYSQQSQPVAGTGETASVSFTGTSATNVLSWSLSGDDRWNLGALFSAEKNPQANYTMRANASVGVEYDLVPRQTVNQKNLGFRCAAGPEFERYDATNIEGKDQQLVGRQFCDVFLSWHFVPVDLWASVGETTLLEDVSFRAFSASVSATWRLTDDLTLSPWVSVQQVNLAPSQARPNDVVYTDPKQEIVASMIAAAQQAYVAPFGIQSGLTIRYLFGNGSLASEDQRWKGASNLR
jgi:hypothetical protein